MHFLVDLIRDLAIVAFELALLFLLGWWASLRSSRKRDRGPIGQVRCARESVGTRSMKADYGKQSSGRAFDGAKRNHPYF